MRWLADRTITQDERRFVAVLDLETISGRQELRGMLRMGYVAGLLVVLEPNSRSTTVYVERRGSYKESSKK